MPTPCLSQRLADDDPRRHARAGSPASYRVALGLSSRPFGQQLETLIHDQGSTVVDCSIVGGIAFDLLRWLAAEFLGVLDELFDVFGRLGGPGVDLRRLCVNRIRLVITLVHGSMGSRTGGAADVRSAARHGVKR
jgi:hypothetical protein